MSRPRPFFVAQTLLLAALTAGAALSASACSSASGKAADTAAPPVVVPVQTARVVSEAVTRAVRVTGSLLADEQAEVSAEVNGRVVQQGRTSDMIHDVAALIEYLSGFMTLGAGDLILTGTPKGSHDVQPGDEVVCEVERVGRLVNTLVADWPAAG